MSGSSQDDAIGTTARRCADARRVMVGAWGDQETGRSFALDQMGIHPSEVHEGHLRFADAIREASRTNLAASDLFLADDPMVELLDAAAPTMPDQELDLRDVIAPRGFLWFSTPLPDRSDSPPHVPVRALSWAVLPPEHVLLSERGDGKTSNVLLTSYVKTLEAAKERLRAQGETGHEVALAPGAPGLTPDAAVMWAEGTLIGAVFGEVPKDPRFTPGFYQRVAAAFWTLAQQPLTTREEAPAGARADRRRAARAGVENPSGPVHVIRLRAHEPRSGGEGAGESGRKVSVRFPTRGHWRNQWLPSTQTHRHQWIAPHWRGPVDAPIKGGERVFLAHGQPSTDDTDRQ